MIRRSTVIVADRLAHRRVTLDAARYARHGTIVTTPAGLASRLAGAFVRVADDVDVRRALRPVPANELEELQDVAGLPGFARAASTTLRSAWNADLDVAALAEARGGRWRDVAALERRVRTRLPVGARTLRDVVAAARRRVRHAPRVTGDVLLDGVDEVPPVYRPLLADLARHVEVRWRGPSTEPPGPVPDGVAYEGPEVHAPALDRADLERTVCADPHHEVVEAFRWARGLLARGEATPDQIAIGAASCEPYEEAVLALAEEANLPLHAAHGVPALSERDGQVAAALADVLVRGLDRDRAHRFVSVARAPGAGAPELAELPGDWARVLPNDAPLATLDRWERALAPREDEDDPVREVLRELGRDLARGTDAAATIGERWLRGRPRELWRRALDEGPAAAVDVSLDRLRVDDGVDPACAIAWAPASCLVGSPRPRTWLLGLASRSWPRRSSDDPLLPRHVLDGTVLHERTVAQTDRRHFAILTSRCARTVVLSRARRDAEGRKLAPSPLLRTVEAGEERSLAPRRLPEHAFSEADRRLARPGELAADPHARAALATWRGWMEGDLGPHDGRVRPDHPAVARALDRVHSATSLQKLLRNPIAFVWTYALGWREPNDPAEDLGLDKRDRGELLHRLLEAAVADLEDGPGLAAASEEAIEAAARRALPAVADAWSIERPVPPEILWNATLDELRAMTVTALTMPVAPLDGQRSFVEVPFGLTERDDPLDAADLPWDPFAEVRLAGSGLRIRGRIDRLDLGADGRRARVVDYKSSTSTRKLADRAVDVDEGRELQRCLYAFAVRDRLGIDEVDAMLLYPATDRVEAMRDAAGTLDGLARAVDAAAARLREGWVVPGPDAYANWFDLRLALPADLGRGYAARKEAALTAARDPIDAILLAEPGEDAGKVPA